MIKPILAALVAAFIPTTAAVASIHDFDPSRVNTASANITGNCYETNDTSRFCYMQTGAGQYVLSIVDNDDRSYPQVLSVNCSNGDYRGWGVLNNDQLRIWASAFCKGI